jgi:hypothetical protein
MRSEARFGSYVVAQFRHSPRTDTSVAYRLGAILDVGQELWNRPRPALNRWTPVVRAGTPRRRVRREREIGRKAALPPTD